MTTRSTLERDLPTILDDVYVGGLPDYRDDLVQRIAATRQRPAWAFPERWLHMDIATQAVPTARMPWRQLGVLALIALLVAAAAAVYVGSRPRLPAPFGFAANGQLVYIEGGDVFVRDSVGAAPRAIVSGPETETVALFSPLGDRLAVARDGAGGEDVWVGAADGSGLIRIGGPYLFMESVEWAPDGLHLAIGHSDRGIPRIDLVAIDGSGSRRVADFPAQWPTFRPPDGSQLLFRGQEADGRWGFYLVDTAGGEPVRLDIYGDGIERGVYDFWGPAWAPAGDRLAYHQLVKLPESRGQTPGFRISIAAIAPDGSVTGITPLEFDPASDDESDAVFTPDGEAIVFLQRFGLVGQTSYTDAAWIASADGGDARPLGVQTTDGEGFVVVMAPDGTAILIHLRSEQEDWLVDPVSSSATLTDVGSSSGISWQRRAP